MVHQYLIVNLEYLIVVNTYMRYHWKKFINLLNNEELKNII